MKWSQIMKKYFLLIVLLLSAAAFAQPNWTGVKETNINVGSASSVDIFTNQDGNHIIVQEGNSLKYYRMNLDGYSDPAIFPKTIESIGVSSPSISGDANNLYIVYGVGNSVRTKRSTDKGISWSTITNHIYQSTISGTESVFSNGNLHVTFQRDSKIWYRYRNQTSGNWSGVEEVSINENGTNPRITALYGGTNNDYVYFLYQKANENVGKWRRYEVTGNSWGTLYTGIGLLNLLSTSGVRVLSDRIIIYYNYLLDNIWYFRWISNDFNNNPLGSGSTFGNYNSKIYSTTTADNNSHTVFHRFNVSGGPDITDLWEIYRSQGASGNMSDVVYGFGEEENPGIVRLNLSSAGNDVHVIWKDIFGNNNGNNLRYIYDDQTPLAPTSLTLSQGINNHPLLQWTKNNEPDITVYKV
jgi:hypothetical protein